MSVRSARVASGDFSGGGGESLRQLEMCLEGLQVSVFLMNVTKCPFSDAGLGVKAISPSCPPPPTLPPACWVGRRGDGGRRTRVGRLWGRNISKEC